MGGFIGRTLGGRYEIVELAGRGGTADTYRAIDKERGREVAVKMLVDRSDEVNQRFLRDAQTMTRLRHPRIVEVFEVAGVPETPYIVTEFVRGKTLRALERGSISYRRAIAYLIDVLEALAYAHAHGVIHRDVKPGNVMAVEDGTHVKLMDFGLARRAGDVTQAAAGGQGDMLGYLAPERFLGKPADVRSDLYSVGVIAYEMFTGAVPFRNDSSDLVATIFSHVHDAPAPPSEINGNVPEALERIIMRAIDKDPRKRYQTARDFIVDLETLLSPDAAGMQRQPVPPERSQAFESPTQLRRSRADSKALNEAYEAVLKGMLATRRRRYDDAKTSFTCALDELRAAGNRLEYAKTTLKYGTMILQKASDGLRDPDELREGVERLSDALAVFRENRLVEQLSEAEYLINALERTAIGR